ncbi:MAG TPA: WD40 repeat domain-containing protein, partial [Verrucomicrobiae bacterium]|nr:WD40 repeat domain-containing protein [Verrucomicrobiae bacterium]
QELEARHWAYASDMNAAKQALDQNNLGKAKELLDRQRPKPGQVDLRGWEWRYLWLQTRSDALFSLPQKESEIYSLSVSGDGRLVAASVRGTGGVSVYELPSRREVSRLGEGEYDVRAALSPAGAVLAFAGADGHGQSVLHVFDLSTGTLQATQALDGVCSGLAFSRNGDTLATSTVAGHVTVWGLPEASRLARYRCEQTSSIGTAFAATPDLKVAAYASANQIRVLDLRTGRQRTLAITTKDVTALAISADANTLASFSGFDASYIQIWDVATGREIGRLAGHRSWVNSLAFYDDGKKLISASADQTIRIWDVPARTCLDTLFGHRQEVWRTALMPDGKTLVTGAKDGAICLWDISTKHPRGPCVTFPGTYANWTFGVDGRSVLTVSGTGEVTRWSGRNFQRQETLLNLGLDENRLERPCCLSSDGNELAIGSGSRRLQVWDISRQSVRREWTELHGEVEALCFVDKGKRLFCRTVGEDSCLVLDVANGREVQSWQPPPGLSAGGFSADTRFWVGAGLQAPAELRDLPGQRTEKLRLDLREPNDFTFSPDDHLIAGTSSLGFARVW